MNVLAERARKQQRESRAFTTGFELRAKGDSSVTFDGIASVVDTPYDVHDMFGTYSETMMAGAFKKTLRERDNVRLLVNHDGVPLASTKAGTLQLSETPDLHSVAELDTSNPTVQEIRSAMTRGDMDQMSIGFQVTRQEWNGDYTERFIKEVKLFDVSVVTFPANEATSAQLRSLADAVAMFRAEDVEEADITRAITYLQGLLPQPVEQREQVDITALRALLWARR